MNSSKQLLRIRTITYYSLKGDERNQAPLVFIVRFIPLPAEEGRMPAATQG